MTGIYVLHSKLEYVKLFVLYRDVKFTITVIWDLTVLVSVILDLADLGPLQFCLHVVEAYLFD